MNPDNMIILEIRPIKVTNNVTGKVKNRYGMNVIIGTLECATFTMYTRKGIRAEAKALADAGWDILEVWLDK